MRRVSAVRLLLVAALVVAWSSSSRGADFPWTLRWRYPLGAGAVIPPAPGDSLVQVGDERGFAAALRLGDGVPRWRRAAAGPLSSSGLLAPGAVVWGDAEGQVTALEARTGDQLWQRRLPGAAGLRLALADSMVLVAAVDGSLCGLRLHDGTEQWRIRCGQRLQTPPVRSGGDWYTPAARGAVWGFRVDRGWHWERAAPAPGPGPSGTIEALAAAGDALVAGLSDGYVRAFAAAGGVLWARRLGRLAPGALLAWGERVLAGSRAGWLYALQAGDGRVAWQSDLGSVPAGIVVADDGADGAGCAMVGTAAGRLLCVELGTGTVLWEAQVDASGAIAPVACTPNLLLLREGDGSLAAFARAAPLAAESPGQAAEWWVLREGGRAVGYRKRLTRTVLRGGEPVLERVDTAVDWRGSVVHSASLLRVDRALRPLAFQRCRAEGSQRLEEWGTWSGDSLIAGQRLAGWERLDTVLAGRDFVMPEWLGEVAVRLLPDSSMSGLRVFDYAARKAYPAAGELERGAAGCGGEAPSGPPGLLLRREVEARGGVRLPVCDRLDADGHLLARRIPLLGFAQERATAMDAVRWAVAEPWPLPVVDEPVPDPTQVEELALLLPELGFSAEALFVTDERQSVEVRPDGRVAVRTRAWRGPVHQGTPASAGGEAYVQPSLYVQSDAPQIRRIAAMLQEDGATGAALAERIRQWVHDHMVPRSTQVGLRSAVEVLSDMEGTCSEHAVLCLAIARACGLPARACTGLLVQESGQAVPHVWAQVLADGWHHLDATLPPPGISAAHLQCGSGAMALADMEAMNLPLQLLLANVDTLAVLEYRRAGDRFDAQVARLYRAAQSAQREGAEEEALALLEQVVAAPWGVFTGPALLDIARARLRAGQLEAAASACEQVLQARPRGPSAPEALYVLSQVAEVRHDQDALLGNLRQLVDIFPENSLADDALARAGQVLREMHGCGAALPVYERLQREYAESGWAEVAARVISECRQEDANGALREAVPRPPSDR